MFIVYILYKTHKSESKKFFSKKNKNKKKHQRNLLKLKTIIWRTVN